MTIPGSANPLLSISAAGGYQIERSIRLNAPDSAYLSRLPGTAGNRRTWTFSCWLKRSALSSFQSIFACIDSGATHFGQFILESDDKIYFYDSSASGSIAIATQQVFRDVSSWYHLVLYYNTTATAAEDKLRLYVNGQNVTNFSTDARSTITTDGSVNRAEQHSIGSRLPRTSGPGYLNGYLADVHFIDGQAIDPSSFGEFDTNGVWQPIDASGLTYGTNGFHLPFSDNSTAAALGTDTSDNGNDWTVNNISVGSTVSYITGSTLDTPINAFDGSLSTSATIDTTTRTLTNQSITVGSQFEVYTNNYDLQTITISAGGNSYQVQKHPSNDWTVLNNADSQNNTPFTGTLSGPISIVRSLGSAALYAVRVDGVILVDASVVNRGNDSLRDSPTNGSQTDTGVGGELVGNYCTANFIHPTGGTCIFSNGNLQVVTPTDNNGLHYCTIGVTSGKWYWESVMASGNYAIFGIAKAGHSLASGGPGLLGGSAEGWGYYTSGSKVTNGSFSSYGASWVAGDVIGVAFDADAGTLTFYKNNASQGTAFTGLTSGPYFPAASDGSTSFSSTLVHNFGQRQFSYAAPAGFKALCTTNLPEGTITTSGTFTGNALADGPFVYLNGVPTAMTINGNAVTFATDADKLSNGFKVRTSSASYNTAGSNTYSISTTGAKFKYARAQANP
jgi:hypothetical protein